MSGPFILTFCFVLMIPIITIVYHMIPGVFYRWGNPKYKIVRVSHFNEKIETIFNRLPFPQRMKKHLISKIEESGIGDSITWIYWIGITVLVPVLLFLILSLRRHAVGSSVAICSLCFVVPNIYLQGQIEKRKRAFVINVYKLYYFLHSQISSGIKATDAIKGLYEIADHPLIQKIFIKFVAQYELTLNIEESLQVLRKSFSGYDCEMLCVSIQQCINTGMAGRTLLKMEQMMFAKYFFYLQKDTEKYKTKLLVSGLFAILPLVMIFLFPMIADAMKAFGSMMKITG